MKKEAKGKIRHCISTSSYITVQYFGTNRLIHSSAKYIKN
jgi:hypothetical protein